MPEIGHGGDVYADGCGGQLLDFSANINPLGTPPDVLAAARDALTHCAQYPDPLCRALRTAVAAREGVSPPQVFCGGGAADVLYRLLLALRPRRVLLPAPTFSEYERAAKCAGSAVVRVPLDAAQQFDIGEAFWHRVQPDIDLVIVCNPNNPTGRICTAQQLAEGLMRCERAGARLLVDECFADFTEQPEQLLLTPLLQAHRRLVLLRSFTKMYAVAGIRLGYCLSADTQLLEQLYQAGPPWSVSGAAQACGIAAARDVDYPARTRRYVARQRTALADGLRALGLSVIEGAANFLLFRSENTQLDRQLRTRGILIRPCANFPGLDAHWFRAAVRTETEQFVLLHALRELKKQNNL